MQLSFLHLPRGHGQGRPAPVAPVEATEPQPSRDHLPGGFVSYRWLVDPKRQIVGFHFGWVPCRADAARAGAHHINALTQALSDGFTSRAAGWRMGNTAMLFDVSPALWPEIEWRALPAKRIVLRWDAADLTEESVPLLKELRSQGFSHMVSGDLGEQKELRELMTHVDVGSGDDASLHAARTFAHHPVRPIATAVADWATFDECARHQVPALIEPTIEPPPRAPGKQGLEAEAMLIVRLLQLIQRNEDVRVIEAAVKHDATLTFKLLQHINSPAVGAGVQIESLHHAVAMLGYSRLFRFLSTLLTGTDAKSRPPYLTRKAIVRGRFVELLGHTLLGAAHADNLFLAGMFSLLDQLLGIPMAELLDQVQLADAVQRAILSQDGIYGPFLKLALACEAGAQGAEAIADELFMSAQQVNAARLGAIAWSQEVSRSEAMY